jgi:hypothetical protein
MVWKWYWPDLVIISAFALVMEETVKASISAEIQTENLQTQV